jgi:hypothetical protein
LKSRESAAAVKRVAEATLKAEKAKQQAYIDTASLQLEALGMTNSLDQQFQAANARALKALEDLEKKTFKGSGRGRAKKDIGTADDIELQMLRDRADQKLEIARVAMEEEERLREEQLAADEARAKERLRIQKQLDKEREKQLKAQIENETRMRANAAAAGMQAMSDLGTLMNTESRKAFAVGKAAAISEATISTSLGAQKAFTSLAGIPVVGPALGGLAASAAIAAGAVRIQQIASTEFGGGGNLSNASVSLPTSSAGSTSAVNASPEQEIMDRRPIQVIMDGRMVTDAIVNDSIKRQQRGDRGLVVRT